MDNLTCWENIGLPHWPPLAKCLDEQVLALGQKGFDPLVEVVEFGSIVFRDHDG